MFVPSPRPGTSPSDHFLECQESLEPYFNAMIGRAVNAGWDEIVATEAAISLAEKHGLAHFANAEVTRMIKRLPRADSD